MMLNVTQEAKLELRQMLQQSLPHDEPRPDVGLRLLPSSAKGSRESDSSTLGLSLDLVRDGDQVVREAEWNVLLLDRAVSTAVDGLTLDVADTAEGRRLIITTDEPA